MSIVAWNVRGLNKSKKQKAVRDFVFAQKSGIVCFFEHKIRSSKEKGVRERLFLEWGSFYNNEFDERGRIWLIWDRKNYSIDVLDVGAQWIHTRIIEHGSKRSFFITFVYGYNKQEERTELCEAIQRVAKVDEP